MPENLRLLIVLLVCFGGLLVDGADGEFRDLEILHFNDFHARFEKVDPKTSGNCDKKQEHNCYGGFARLHSYITDEKKRNPDLILLNAGDVFTGTLWYGLFKWNVTAHFMNMLPMDAMTIGNHEFDTGGVYAATEYMKLMKNIPALIANVDASQEPEFDSYIKKSIIIERKGIKIGIVGYVTTDYMDIATVGELKILEEISAVSKECSSLRRAGVDVNILLSHAGFQKDKMVAKYADADLIVGGHSHTFLYTGEPPSPYDHPVSEYPTVVVQDNGRKVLVVQAAAFSRYIGKINLKYSKEGSSYRLQSWSGNPILLNGDIITKQEIESELEPWRQKVQQAGSRKVGESLVLLDHTNFICYFEECNVGQLIADAMIYEYVKKREGRSWTKAAVAIIHSGGIRSSIPQGEITYADVWNTMPFEDFFGLIELNGQHLLEVLEASVDHLNSPFLQIAGIKAVFNWTQPRGQRVSDVYVRCAKCAVPKYEPIRLYSYYPIILSEYIYEGGDGLRQIKKNSRYWTKGRADINVLLDYFREQSPVYADIKGDVIVHGSQKIRERILKAKRMKLQTQHNIHSKA